MGHDLSLLTLRSLLQAGDFDIADGGRSQKTAGGRTARRKAWAATDVFSDDSGEGRPATVSIWLS